MAERRGSDLVAKAIGQLRAAGVADPARDARRLMAHVLDISPGRLTLVLPDPIGPDLADLYGDLVDRRAHRVPVSHLIGVRQFYGRDFAVSSDVLDPRPETEILIEAALAEPFASVLDLGTGSGCILLTLLAERHGAVGIGTDLSADALVVAQKNAAAFGLQARSEFRCGSWFDPLTDQLQFDLIVSNPPYIALEEMQDLAPEVRDHEPRMALTDEADGLNAYRAILSGCPPFLAPEGRVLVEIGPTQAAQVGALMAAQGLIGIEIVQDLDGRDRVVIGRNPAKSPQIDI